jgi:4-amino-4-deoxy-L-arabinose transferase-like glycosyltransferase
LAAAASFYLEGITIRLTATLKRFAVQLSESALFISGLLFLLALLPRLLNLDQFLTADEFLWVDRSRNFLAGIVDPTYECHTPVTGWELAQGLACTLRTGHPGVTTMWTGSFGLWLSWLATGPQVPLAEYLRYVSTDPLQLSLVAPVRLGTVLITSVWVVAVYWLVRRLFGPGIALLSALFLALNPFHIGLSRVIHHDALSTTFMTLSALTALIFWGQRENRRWLIASGILGGLGFVSKSPALFLMPFIALVGVWFTVVEARRQAVWYSFFVRKLFTVTLLNGVLWFLIALLTAVAVWPAMWVNPVETVEMVLFVGSKYATGGHAKGNFFMGEISNDPGALFYPVTWAYRSTPLVMAGVLFALGGWGWWLFRRPRADRRSQEEKPAAGYLDSFFAYLPLLLLFVIGYYLLMTVGDKKQGRYFLPAYPWIDIIAAGGLVFIVNAVSRLFNRDRATALVAGWGLGAVVALLLLLNGYFVTSHYPYYFTYYNPLLGGIRGAEKVLTVGWGEGLDQAAAYLNSQTSPNQTRVSSWYQSTFAPYYYGSAISYSKEKGKALAGDYVVFYINQVQRRFPDEILFEYYARRFNPKHVVTLHGVDYAWVFPGLGIDHYIDDQVYTGIGALLAWQWAAGDGVRFSPGESVPFELYWEYLGKNPDEPILYAAG